MRSSILRSTTTNRNSGFVWTISGALLILSMILIVCYPVSSIAQGQEAAATQEMVQDVSEPTSAPALPTAIPPTLAPVVIPTEVPPTMVPTAVPTTVPTEVPPTASPTVEPTTMPTEQVWINSDTVVVEGPSNLISGPGGVTDLVLIYNVTTPRSSTTVHARLDAGEGWHIESPSMPDANPHAREATWTNADTLLPDATFRMPVRITAPASMAHSETVSVHMWSTAAGEGGAETAVVETGSGLATIDAIAPENTDTVSAVIPDDLELQPGDAISIDIAYSVTTPRMGTKVQATLENEDGTPALGWTIVAAGESDALIKDAAARVPGDSFTATYTVTAPDDVEIPHGVSLRLWSDVETVTGIQSALDDHALALVPVRASAAEPQAVCTADDATTIACDIDPDRADATSASITVTSAPGWAYEINGKVVPSTGGLSFADLELDPAMPQELVINAIYQGTCANPAADHSAALAIDYTYQHVESASVTADLAVEASSSAPSVSITSVTFQDMNMLETNRSLGTLVIDLADIPATCGWRLEATFDDFESEMMTAPASYLTLVNVSGIDGVTATMSGGVISIEGKAGAAPGQSTGTLTITTMMTFPVEMPPGGYQTAVTVKAERLQ